MTFIPVNQTFQITVNGFVNLGTALTDAGYAGDNDLHRFEIVNNNATACYVNLTPTTANPGDGTVGIAVGTGAPGVGWHCEAPFGTEGLLQADHIVLYAASSVVVKVVVQGGQS